MNKKQRNIMRLLAQVGFYVYMILIFYFVLFSERYGRLSHTTYQYNLVLFKEIKRFIVYAHYFSFEELATNLFGNIFAFSPFGFLLPFMRDRKTGFFTVLFGTFCFSLSIESMQLIFKLGVFDVDDLLMNTIGGIIGYLAYKIVRRVYHGKKRSLSYHRKNRVK